MIELRKSLSVNNLGDYSDSHRTIPMSECSTKNIPKLQSIRVLKDSIILVNRPILNFIHTKQTAINLLSITTKLNIKKNK